MSYSATKTAEDLLPFLDSAVEHFGCSDIWWRGQANSSSDWSLLPSIFRRKDPAIIEQDFANRFRRKAISRHPQCPPFYDNTGWLFMMQHYRLPTRLLDWSESLLIATFFAVTEEIEKPGALWALSPFSLNQDQFAKRCIFEPDGDTLKPLIMHAFKERAPGSEKIAAVSSKEVDLRVMVQLSVFTIHGSDKPLESLPNHEKFLMKFEIPSESKKRLKQMLWDLGVRKSNIFPDLENLAKEMSEAEYIIA